MRDTGAWYWRLWSSSATSFLPIAGYLLSTAVTVFVLMLLVSRDRLVLKAVLGSATAVVLFVLFAELLNIRLPTPLVRGVL